MDIGPLLNWATSTGRIHDGERGRWVNLCIEGREREVVATLLAAPPDPAVRDGDAPLPWGVGDPKAWTMDRMRADVAARAARVAAAKRRGKVSHEPWSIHRGLRRVAAASPALPASPSLADRLSGVWEPIPPSELPGQTRPRPTLFPEGDLPSFTASGLDPNQLLHVPWQARKALARASTQAEAYRLLSRYSGPDAETQAEIDAMPGGPLYKDVFEYSSDVQTWASNPGPNSGTTTVGP